MEWQTEHASVSFFSPGTGTQEASDKGCSLQTLAPYADALIGGQMV